MISKNIEKENFSLTVCVCVCVDNYCHNDDKQIGFKLWEYYVDDYGHGTNLSYWNFSFFFWKLFNIFHCSFQCPKMYYSIHSSYMKTMPEFHNIVVFIDDEKFLDLFFALSSHLWSINPTVYMVQAMKFMHATIFFSPFDAVHWCEKKRLSN